MTAAISAPFREVAGGTNCSLLLPAPQGFEGVALLPIIYPLVAGRGFSEIVKNLRRAIRRHVSWSARFHVQIRFQEYGAAGFRRVRPMQILEPREWRIDLGVALDADAPPITSR